jgi:cysteine desulfurase
MTQKTKFSQRRNRMKKIYLDHAAGAPLDGAVFSSMKKFLAGNYANPSALHKDGIKARAAINEAREKAARVLGCQKEEIIFTSGGTEANNLAIMGVILEHTLSPALHIVTTNIEHPSVLEVCRHLEKNKMAEVAYVPVEANGIVDPKKIKEAMRRNTALVSVAYANSEIGTIQPIMEIAKEIRHFRKMNNSRFPLFHTDAAQAMNYLPAKADKLGVDLMSFNASKIYGPKGSGALFKKRNANISPVMFGGDQEFRLRPGTENVAGIVGLSCALDIAEKMKEKESKRLSGLRDYFISGIKKQFKGVIINGDEAMRLPNNVNISVPGIESDLLVIELDARGIAVSAKTACESDDPEESYVIKAIRPGWGGEEGSVRFSLGRGTSKADIDYALAALGDILAKLKKWYS